jgi:hypothetical protein
LFRGFRRLNPTSVIVKSFGRGALKRCALPIFLVERAKVPKRKGARQKVPGYIAGNMKELLSAQLLKSAGKALFRGFRRLNPTSVIVKSFRPRGIEKMRAPYIFRLREQKLPSEKAHGKKSRDILPAT